MSPARIPTVLSIAGSDPSGGAGLAADLKTATALGVYGMAIPTVITVQTPSMVRRVAPLPVDIVAEQLAAVLGEMPVDAVKIGMLGTTGIAEAVLSGLASVKVPIVMDPVLRSTTGTTLGSVEPTVFQALLERATVITPNTDELVGIVGEGHPGPWAIAHGCALLHTGGHGEEDTIHDVLWLPNSSLRRWSHPRVPTTHTHGSGCTLSTALAAYLAKGLELVEAAERAVHYTSQLVERSARHGIVAENGPLLHGLQVD